MPDLFPFVQLEFTHALGPEPGQYVCFPPLAEGEPTATGGPKGTADVLVIEVIGGRPASEGGIIRRRTRTAGRRAEGPVPIALATVAFATQAIAEERAAQSWLREINSAEAEQETWIGEAITILNRAIRAYRAAAIDPYVVEVTRTDPRAVRIGYGKAAEVYKGRWRAAIEPPAPRGPRLSRTEKLRPTEAIAAVLSRRAFVLASEDLALRALLDAELGRGRAAAVQLAAAIELLLSEVGDEEPPTAVSERLREVTARRAEVAELKRSGLEDTLDQSVLAERVSEICLQISGVAATWRYELTR